MKHCRPLLMLVIALVLSACSGIPTITAPTKNATTTTTAAVLPSASHTPWPPTLAPQPPADTPTPTITPAPNPFQIFQGLAPGAYLIYTERRGLGMISMPEMEQYFLAPILDDWTMISPNKKFFAYAISGKPYLYSIGEDREIALNYPDGSCISPDWSPDSQKVVYSCQQGAGYDLTVFSVADLTYQRVTDCADTTDYCAIPKWSPDGSRIVYMRKPAYSGGAEYTGMYILDTECFRKPTCGKGNGPIVSLNSYAWSPDGSLLAGYSNQGLSIYEYKNDAFNLVGSIGKYGVPETLMWSPDGEFLGYSPVEGKAYIYSFKDREIRELDLPSGSRLRSWLRFP